MNLETRSNYPHERTYLLKLHVDADPKSGVIVGRLEHLASGEQKRFANLAELVACLTDYLNSTHVGA